MGEYADVKRGRILNLLKWLACLDGFEVTNGGNHQWVVKHDSWNRPFPVPFKHNSVSKVIVRELMKRVVETEACTKEQFDQRL
jgi:hypothetical protein